MNSIQLIPNANSAASKMIRSDGVIAFYKAVTEDYQKNYVQLFVTNMQTLITKVGIVLWKATCQKGKPPSYCYTCLSFICKKILNNEALFSEFQTSEINSKGNRGKHSIQTNKINLDHSVSLFNKMIRQIVTRTGLDAFQILLIKKETPINDPRTSSASGQPVSNTSNLRSSSSYISSMVEESYNNYDNYPKTSKWMPLLTTVLPVVLCFLFILVCPAVYFGCIHSQFIQISSNPWFLCIFSVLFSLVFSMLSGGFSCLVLFIVEKIGAGDFANYCDYYKLPFSIGSIVVCFLGFIPLEIPTIPMGVIVIIVIVLMLICSLIVFLQDGIRGKIATPFGILSTLVITGIVMACIAAFNCRLHF